MSSTPPSDTTPSDEASGAGPSLRDRIAHAPTGARVATLVVVALLAGGGAGFAIGHDSAGSSSAPQNLAASFGQGAEGGGGSLAGEQHVPGTLTAKTADSITVKTSSGSSATYTLQATTQIVRNGQASSLSDLQVGDPVLVHIYPGSSGQELVEMVIAGSSATDGGPGGFGGSVPRGFGDDGGDGGGSGFGGDGGSNGFTPQTGGTQGGVSIN